MLDGNYITPRRRRQQPELVIMISKMSHETHSLIANFNFAKLTADAAALMV